MKKKLPIGIDSFREIRESNKYYVDKTLLIKDFIENDDKVTLITRPRRFGKTLNMTMLREFFDITTDSKAIFEGLTIMNTEYSVFINSRPVIYFTFKDCKDSSADMLMRKIGGVILKEYRKYYYILKGNVDETDFNFLKFFKYCEKLLNEDFDIYTLESSIELLEEVLFEYYRIRPILLIDEYDQPIMSSVEYGYYEKYKTFFSGFYGAALKGQDSLHQAMLTGIQRIVKESIFSQLNSIRVYTVIDEKYSGYFGLKEDETRKLLEYCDLELSEQVKLRYDGYLFHKKEMYNPWSVLNYADTGELRNYWINTSTNYLIRKSINEANDIFHEDFGRLIADGVATVSANLGCSFIELEHSSTLWGLLINSGYITVLDGTDEIYTKIRIPNGEVKSEFMEIIAERTNVRSQDLHEMFRYLLSKDLDNFMRVYRGLVISCTSHFDARENAYHMLFLGMCISLNGLYRISSNIEAGYGRSDIRLESFSDERPHIVIEFKQGEDIEQLKADALKQILEKKYCDGLTGEALCIGIAHDKKRCSLAHMLLNCG